MPEIPTATISRLVSYLRILEDLELQSLSLAELPQLKTSSTELAQRANVTAFQVRKDLSYFGQFGKRGSGYNVALLKRELQRVLGLNQSWNVVILGMGRLGRAVTYSLETMNRPFHPVGLFDSNPALTGQPLCGLDIRHTNDLPDFIQAQNAAKQPVDMGLLAVPPEQAQNAAQHLVSAGVRGLLNFAPVVIQPAFLPNTAPPRMAPEWKGVIIENVDFLAGMKRLAFYVLNPHLKQSPLEEHL